VRPTVGGRAWPTVGGRGGARRRGAATEVWGSDGGEGREW
jgi:hypothetical protein